MPVALRRHLVTAKVDGKRVVKPSGFRGSVAEARKLKEQTGATSVKSYSSPVARAIMAARAGQRAFGVKKRIAIRQELGYGKVILKEKEYLDLVMSEKYKGDEVKMIADWLKGGTLGGIMVPAEGHFSKIIRTKLGLGLAAEAGKAGAGSKGIKRTGILLDNLSHSALVEPVVEMLTKGLPNAFHMEKFTAENNGLVVKYLPQNNGKFRAQLTYEGKSWDVTKNLKRYMLPSVKKYLDA